MDISQGSVAAHLRCGGTFNNKFIENLLVSLSVKKKFKKSVNTWPGYGQNYSVLFSFTHSVVKLWHCATMGHGSSGPKSDMVHSLQLQTVSYNCVSKNCFYF